MMSHEATLHELKSECHYRETQDSRKLGGKHLFIGADEDRVLPSSAASHKLWFANAWHSSENG